jgi:hypothetical protein
LCRTEYNSRDDYKKQSGPIIIPIKVGMMTESKVSHLVYALGIDNTELDRAGKALEDAKINVRSMLNESLVLLDRILKQPSISIVGLT